MMLDHLGRHPELFGFRLETYVLPHYLMHEQRYGELAVNDNFLQLWKDMRSEYAFRRCNKGRALDLPADWMDAKRSAAGIFDRIMLKFAEKEGKQRWCEKTPVYALHITKLSRALPASLFIHMLRDGRDCAASDHRRWGRHPNGAIARWKHVVAEGRRQGSLIGKRYLEVRYEDVTNNPRAEMSRVCDFLCVPFSDLVMTTSTSPRNRGVDAKSIIKNQNRGVNYFNAKRLRSLEQIAGRQLSVLGYKNDCPQSNRMPGRFERLWWFIYDTKAVLTRQLRNKLTVQKRMTWSLYLARLKSTVRKINATPPTHVDSRDVRDD